MKHLIIIIFLIAAQTCFSQTLELRVTNPSGIDRKHETVVLKWADLKQHAPWLDPSNAVVHFAGKGEALVTQTIGDEFLFQSDFAPEEERTFVLSKRQVNQESVKSVVDAKYILPRKDVAWENDRIAYRIYGGPLAGNVRNGLDVWVKRVRYPIIDKWYAGDSLKGKARISYHVDHGEGADLFEVGTSLGAGASALWANDVAHQTGLFTGYKIIATGPVRTVFTVFYESDSLTGVSLREEKTYTLDAGQNLNRIDVKYSEIAADDPLQFAAGLVKRKNTLSFADDTTAVLGLWGDTDADSTHGATGTGIIVPRSVFGRMCENKDHYLVIGSLPSERKFTYYAGACWSRSGDFATVDDWKRYLNEFSERFQRPVMIEYVAQ